MRLETGEPLAPTSLFAPPPVIARSPCDEAIEELRTVALAMTAELPWRLLAVALAAVAPRLGNLPVSSVNPGPGGFAAVRDE